MADIQKAEYNQTSFSGGMNLLLEDTHLTTNQYVIGFNLRNRYDRLDGVLRSKEDINIPHGIIQEMVTFGNFEIIFVSGSAYYKFFRNSVWLKINTFAMSRSAPRYWTKAIPVATTNYYRIAATSEINSQKFPNSAGAINLNTVAGAAQGNIPGLVVQDNINQPQFIFINALGIPEARVTQDSSEWSITFTDSTNTVVAANGDKREYVPIGNVMEFVDGILYIASPDGTKIFRSVSGRPLDFMVAVSNALVTTPPYTQTAIGDANDTAYSVGVGPIQCLRAMADNSLFVAAANANFLVSKDKANNALLEFGEYRFVRTFLFNATCLSDRVIFDSLGDTRFIDLTGVRSFNSIAQTKNEGRNTPFTATIKGAFGTDDSPILQNPDTSAAILFNDYELYAVDTIFGPAIAVFDTINQCWSSFDVNQTGGKKIKIFAKIELTVRALYAVTEDNRLFKLYTGPLQDVAQLRPVGVCSSILNFNENVKMPNPRMEIKPTAVRGILNYLTDDALIDMTMYVNNRLTILKTIPKTVTYFPPTDPSTDTYKLLDVDTQLGNFLFSIPNCNQGWKCFSLLTWDNGSLMQFSIELTILTPRNPLNSQVVIKRPPLQRTTDVFTNQVKRTPTPPDETIVLAEDPEGILIKKDDDGGYLIPDT